jgi:hypothetical protein
MHCLNFPERFFLCASSCDVRCVGSRSLSASNIRPVPSTEGLVLTMASLHGSPLAACNHGISYA